MFSDGYLRDLEFPCGPIARMRSLQPDNLRIVWTARRFRRAVVALACLSASLCPFSAWAVTGTSLASRGVNSGSQTAAAANAQTTLNAGGTAGSEPENGSVSASGHASASTPIYCGGTSFSSTSAVYPLGVETECEQGTTGGAYNLRFCPGTQQGETCGGNGPAWEQVAVPAGGGAVQPDPTLTATLGACAGSGATARCSFALTQTGTYSQSNLYGITQQGATAQASQYANNSSVMSSTLGTGVVAQNGTQITSGKNTNSGGYTGEIVANGGNISTCYANQQTQVASGKPVYSCSGNTSVQMGGTCRQTQTCVNWTTTTQTATSTCAQTVNTTSTTCTTQTPTESCTLSNQKQTENCTVQTTPQVSTYQSCTTGSWFDSAMSWRVGGVGSDFCYVSVQCTPNTSSLTFDYYCWGGDPPHNVYTVSLPITPYTMQYIGPASWWWGPWCPSGGDYIDGACYAAWQIGTADPSWNSIVWNVPVYYTQGGCNMATNQCSYQFYFSVPWGYQLYTNPLTLTFTYPHTIANITGNGVNDGCTQYGG